MKTEKININGIPAVIYGEKSQNLYIFIHGKSGCKEEAKGLAEIICKNDFQIISMDLPEHGERKAEKDKFYPWVAVPELQNLLKYAKEWWKNISVYANSIGAYFSLLAFKNEKIEKNLFVSPILDMQALIENMMLMAGIDEKELERKKIIPTSFGEALSWKYYNYSRENKITFLETPTSILYAENDNLTSYKIAKNFAEKFGCKIVVAKNCEHWFHTPEQLQMLDSWIEKNI